MSKIYDKSFYDSTKHTLYTVTILSENNEKLTITVNDWQIRQFLGVVMDDEL